MQVFEDVLEDADSNNDGFLTLDDFLTSYVREKPVRGRSACMHV